jgi:AbrB family looped-hinge helix DNA binding protein
MEILAKLTSKGRVTIPVEVRRALGVRPGDVVVFRVVEGHPGIIAEIRKESGFFELAGAVPTPPEITSMDWSSVRAAAWTAGSITWLRSADRPD